MPEDKTQKVSANIPIDLLEQIDKLGFSSRTEAIIQGLKCIINNTQSENTLELMGNIQEDSNIEVSMFQTFGIIWILLSSCEDKDNYNAVLRAELERTHKDKDRIFSLYEAALKQSESRLSKGISEKKWWEFWK